MKYFGRITASLLLLIIITLWHLSYFWINWDIAYQFLITDQFIKYDFIYTPLLLPVTWWIGKQFDKAKFFSEKDILTEVYNRRFVLTVFPKLYEQIKRRSESLVLILLDCNNFKTINDTYGHKKGDTVLKSIASVLTTQTRKSDIVARWGGDEFLIIAPLVSPNDQAAITKRIEHELESLSQKIGIFVSVSVGTAVAPIEGDSLEDLLHIADKRMYNMKDNFLNHNR